MDDDWSIDRHLDQFVKLKLRRSRDLIPTLDIAAGNNIQGLVGRFAASYSLIEFDKFVGADSHYPKFPDAGPCDVDRPTNRGSAEEGTVSEIGEKWKDTLSKVLEAMNDMGSEQGRRGERGMSETKDGATWSWRPLHGSRTIDSNAMLARSGFPLTPFRHFLHLFRLFY
ncbi:hypothetical protein B0H19DRAFT_1085384 [Mycena capillaripes]|nr:hypothetical protein B0H19DRAFT_1085384 [Mycena capillaripes]